MASIRKRDTVWQVQIRRSGYPTITRTFARKGEASAWARDTEQQIDRLCMPVDYALLRRTTLGDLLARYRETVTPTKRGQRSERYRLDYLLRQPMACFSLEMLTPPLIAEYRDRRLQDVKAGTVRRELTTLRHVLEVAVKEWGLPLVSNPVRMIRLPADGRGRDRRLALTEFDSIVAAAARSRTRLLEPVIRLAIETGLRRSELLSLKWDDLDLSKGTVTVHETKNGHRRTIPLTPEAMRVLGGLERSCDRVLPVREATFRIAWERLKKRLGLVDLHFHDLRHEAISRFFEMGLSVPEVALISGHRDPRMLFRYTHVQAANVALKLKAAAVQVQVQGQEAVSCAS